MFVDHVERAPAYRPVSTPVPNEALPQRMQRFYEELATRRETMLDRLGDLFTDDIEFTDPFRHTHGLAELRTLFERMFEQYRRVQFTAFETSGNDAAFTLVYDMRMHMIIGPEFVTRMASVVVARDGKVAKLSDYYDLGSSLVSPAVWLTGAYQRLMRRLFL
jgi:ketosteroid isomerase-like protein